MKKTILWMLVILAVALAGAAAAEEADAIVGGIEDGCYIVRIPVEANDAGWYADETAEETDAVKLAGAELQDGCFVVRYEPLRDGQTEVTVRHFYNAVACDQAHTWYLTVQNGAIQEVNGGSYTAIPEEEEVDPYLSGTWLEKDTQFTQMIISRNEGRGWDVEITSPLTHGAYQFVATVYQDCFQDAFLYDKGKLFELAADGTHGEPAVVGATGSLQFQMSNDGLVLVWVRDENPDEVIVFERAEEEPEPMPEGADAFSGVWVCGRASIEMVWEEEGFRVFISWGSSAWEHSEWQYSCYYHPENNSLVSLPFGIRTDIAYGNNGEIASEKVIYEDGEATFTLDEEGHLIWQDEKEDAGKDMRFEWVEIVNVE